MDLLDDDGLLNLRSGSRTDPKALVDEIRGRRVETPAINDDLAAWAAEAEARAKDPTPVGRMDCHMCTRSARMQCAGCDRPVCGSHSWVMLGLCRDCASEDRVRRMHQEG